MGFEGEGWIRVCDGGVGTWGLGGGRKEKREEEEEDLGGGREEEREVEVLPNENSDRSCLNSCSSSSEEA